MFNPMKRENIKNATFDELVTAFGHLSNDLEFSHEPSNSIFNRIYMLIKEGGSYEHAHMENTLNKLHDEDRFNTMYILYKKASKILYPQY